MIHNAELLNDGEHLTAELYKCRDSARFILGELYQEKMADYGKKISEVAARLKCSEVSAATKMAGSTDDLLLQMMIFAAAVELAEPSNTVQEDV